jgi:predicted DNA-binding transcriptional regulator
MVLLSVAGLGAYSWLILFVAPLLVVQLTALAAVTAVVLILAWIGYTLATTPPPRAIEEIEKELEEQLEQAEAKEPREAGRERSAP